MSSNLATVTSKGQVTIPKAVRETLGITTNDQLLFVVEEDRVILIPMRQRPLSDLYRALPSTRPYPGVNAVREAVRKEMGKHLDQGEK